MPRKTQNPPLDLGEQQRTHPFLGGINTTFFRSALTIHTDREILLTVMHHHDVITSIRAI